jgi:hypothetical protein
MTSLFPILKGNQIHFLGCTGKTLSLCFLNELKNCHVLNLAVQYLFIADFDHCASSGLLEKFKKVL